MSLKVVGRRGPESLPAYRRGRGRRRHLRQGRAAGQEGADARPWTSATPSHSTPVSEQELLEKINALGIGPQGFGGRTTALAVNIETMPTHIAGLPVAVNINCHVTRHKTEVL